MHKQSNLYEMATKATEVISLSDLLTSTWYSRWAIFIITSTVMAAGVSWALLNAKYKSQGFFQFGGAIPMVKEKSREKEKDWDKDKAKEKDKEYGPGISLSDFKRFAASYSTGERFNDYVKDKQLDSVVGVEGVRKAFASRNGISQVIEPVYPFTKLDAKELVELPKGSSNNVIGLRISYESKSPEIAQGMVGLLGRYAMDSIVYLIYSDLLRFKNEEIKTRMTELDTAIIRNKTQLEEFRRKAEALKKIIAHNPTAASQGTRQVIEISEDSARYLPPVTLLTTAEVQAAEANEAIFKAKHEQVQSQILLEYYDRVKSLLDSTKSGETVLRSLESIKAVVFQHKNLQDDTVKEVYNMITVDNQKAINLYLDKSRFIAGPTLPEYSTVRLGLVLAVSLMFGLLLSMLYVFWRAWWSANKIRLSH